MQFDLTPFVGLTGIPVIEQIVEYLRDYWSLPAYLAPLMALVIGAFLNLFLAWQLHVDPLTGFEIGLAAGFGASFWHVRSKRPLPQAPLSPGSEQ